MNRAAPFATAAAVVAATALLITPRSPAPDRPGERAARPAAPPALQLPPGRLTTPLPARRSSSRDVAQRFLRAFAGYELGRVDEHALRATATRGLADALLSQPPHTTRAHPRHRARLVSLIPVRRYGPAADYDARLRHGHRISLITLGLVRRHGRWRVTALR